ncbi:uncharacterized protein LOC141932988 [Strix aluco]|uniref:uncharacterized protein LOC141932988 n=1 Tax=Strix aluco TaxID=111821 RepID=UPI003DA505FD
MNFSSLAQVFLTTLQSPTCPSFKPLGAVPVAPGAILNHGYEQMWTVPRATLRSASGRPRWGRCPARRLTWTTWKRWKNTAVSLATSGWRRRRAGSPAGERRTGSTPAARQGGLEEGALWRRDGSGGRGEDTRKFPQRARKERNQIPDAPEPCSERPGEAEQRGGGEGPRQEQEIAWARGYKTPEKFRRYVAWGAFPSLSVGALFCGNAGPEAGGSGIRWGSWLRRWFLVLG